MNIELIYTLKYGDFSFVQFQYGTEIYVSKHVTCPDECQVRDV